MKQIPRHQAVPNPMILNVPTRISIGATLRIFGLLGQPNSQDPHTSRRVTLPVSTHRWFSIPVPATTKLHAMVMRMEKMGVNGITLPLSCMLPKVKPTTSESVDGKAKQVPARLPSSKPPPPTEYLDLSVRNSLVYNMFPSYAIEARVHFNCEVHSFTDTCTKEIRYG